MGRARDEYRFEPIDIDVDTAVGIGLPFKGTRSFFNLNYTTEKQAISNLKNLLLTRKGERYMQPHFGWSGWDLIFEQNNPDLIDKLKLSIKMDIGNWLPYIIVDNIQIAAAAADIDHGITISFTVTVEPGLANTTITIDLSSQGGVTITEG